jgi:hypothetical protein
MKSSVLLKIHQHIFGIFGNYDTVSFNPKKAYRINELRYLVFMKNPYGYKNAKIGENEDICF